MGVAVGVAVGSEVIEVTRNLMLIKMSCLFQRVHIDYHHCHHHHGCKDVQFN